MWSLQAARVDRVIDYARSARAQLVVVVFGDLTDLARTAPFTDKVTAYVRGRGVTVIDLREHVGGEDPRALVVSRWDAHPSKALHRRVADWLADFLTGVPPISA